MDSQSLAYTTTQVENAPGKFDFSRRFMHGLQSNFITNTIRLRENGSYLVTIFGSKGRVRNVPSCLLPPLALLLTDLFSLLYSQELYNSEEQLDAQRFLEQRAKTC